ncbi:Ral guanine nucleotide dissociation stimulator-like 2 [Varanus komodoensis]|nr:Ral guanine nucleotide dissociation stimulator-like 2 [Varanus komodoensis]
MLTRSLRHLLDGGGDAGVTLSAFRSRGSPPEGDPPPAEQEAAGPGTPAGQSRVLKAGSLPRLARHLLEAAALGDACYVPAFLATYRTFAAPHVVLGLLLDRLQAVAGPGSDVTPETAELQRALGSVLWSWLDGYPDDFVGLEPGLRGQLLGWLRWALGDGSEPERILAASAGERAPPVTPEEDAGAAGDGEADPHYILGLQAEDVAAHLTARDAELFLRVVPHECLGSLWSQRDKKGHEGDCPTVRATVAQFNLVAKAVVSSCLGDTGLRAAQRARLLEKWIRVAEECLCLRDFSSLYAVVSALHSTPLHRLKRTWEEMSRDSLRCYEALSAVCSEEDNYSQTRRLLFQGVVPYLGTFLKDLVMLDTATRNRLQNGYINFEKHRKEFEILTQLRLLQARCRNYALSPDRALQTWLRRLPQLSEVQSYQLSCAIEPPAEGATPGKPTRPALVITHCTELKRPRSLSLASDGFPCKPATNPVALRCTDSNLAQAKWPSVSSLDVAPESTVPPSPGGLAPPPTPGGCFTRGHRRSASCGSAYPTAPEPGSASASDCRIIRVSMALHNGSLYKSILVTSQDKAPAVIAKVLEKHGQDRGQAPQYELVQLLPDGRELAFPPLANVFYAMNGSSLDFMLRPKRPLDSPLPPPPPAPAPRGVELSATFPKIKATGRKIARALF